MSASHSSSPETAYKPNAISLSIQICLYQRYFVQTLFNFVSSVQFYLCLQFNSMILHTSLVETVFRHAQLAPERDIFPLTKASVIAISYSQYQ